MIYNFDAASNVVRQLSPVNGSTVATINIGNAPYLGQGGMAFRQDGVGFLSTVLELHVSMVSNRLKNVPAATPSDIEKWEVSS